MHQPAHREQSLSEPLYHRWFRHGTKAAKEVRSWINAASRQAGETALTLNLLFSFVYGGAVAASLWWIWVSVDCSFHPAWIVAPLAVILTADWTEHFIQPVCPRHDRPSNERGIYTLWIQISSCATMIQLWLTVGLCASVIGLALRMIVSLSDRRLVVGAAE